MKLKKLLIFVIIIILALITIDQTSKILINKYVENDIVLIPNILTIEKVENEGMAFGFNKQNFSNILLMLIILGVIINYLIKQRENLNKKNIVFISLILAGGFSNLIDRIFKGAVFDFIKIGSFPVFNFADMFIVIGWVLFVISFIFFSVKEIRLEN